jgi:hypothetical protein
MIKLDVLSRFKRFIFIKATFSPVKDLDGCGLMWVNPQWFYLDING